MRLLFKSVQSLQPLQTLQTLQTLQSLQHLQTLQVFSCWTRRFLLLYGLVEWVVLYDIPIQLDALYFCNNRWPKLQPSRLAFLPSRFRHSLKCVSRCLPSLRAKLFKQTPIVEYNCVVTSLLVWLYWLSVYICLTFVPETPTNLYERLYVL